MKTVSVIAFLVAAILAQPAAHAEDAAMNGIKRTDLQRHDISVPGREAYQVKVDFEPGAGFPRHTHPGEEIIYVLAGPLEYHFDGQAPVTLQTGDVLFVPAGTVHSARNVGSGTASELATYVLEKGKPPVAIVK